MKPTLILAMLCTGALMTFGACGTYHSADPHYAEVVDLPPEPLDEEIPAPPGDGYTWVSGYWYWSGDAYVWQRGRWERPPATGHVWVRSGWVYHDGGHRFVRGYWAPPHYVRRYRYVRPAPRAVYNRPAYRAVPRRRR